MLIALCLYFKMYIWARAARARGAAPGGELLEEVPPKPLSMLCQSLRYSACPYRLAALRLAPAARFTPATSCSPRRWFASANGPTPLEELEETGVPDSAEMELASVRT